MAALFNIMPYNSLCQILSLIFSRSRRLYAPPTIGIAVFLVFGYGLKLPSNLAVRTTLASYQFKYGFIIRP